METWGDANVNEEEDDSADKRGPPNFIFRRGKTPKRAKKE